MLSQCLTAWPWWLVWYTWCLSYKAYHFCMRLLAYLPSLKIMLAAHYL